MAKATKKEPEKYDEKVGIKGDFLDVFKVVKKHKEDNAIHPDDAISAETWNLAIEKTNLPIRVKDVLLANNVKTLTDLTKAYEDTDLMTFQGVGTTTIDLVEKVLEFYGIRKFNRKK